MDLREKILISAYEMFGVSGYEKTTIQGIIKQVGCSKGGFYHHFSSKDEILDEIIVRDIESLAKHFDKITVDGNKKFNEQFNEIYKFVIDYKVSQLGEIDKISNIYNFSGNEKILRKINEKFKQMVHGYYLKLFLNAISKGEIEIEYVDQVSQLCSRQILWLIEEIRNAALSGNKDKAEKVFKFSEKLIAQSLGVSSEMIDYQSESFRYLDQIIKSMDEYRKNK